MKPLKFKVYLTPSFKLVSVAEHRTDKDSLVVECEKYLKCVCGYCFNYDVRIIAKNHPAIKKLTYIGEL